MRKLFIVLLFISISWIIILRNQSSDNLNGSECIRIGFFPNLTHPQALVAQEMTARGNGWFERYLPKNVKIEWQRFNAGPSAMENIIMGNLDLSYVGPSPAINLYMRTFGQEVRLLSGATRGGSGLVIQQEISINTPNDWAHKKIATPQFGNTQDIACRAWFKKYDIEQPPFLLPTLNADQLILFKKKQIDGAWTIEPWLSRLIDEGNGKLFFKDDTSWTTILVGSNKFCTEYNNLELSIKRAHEELTKWIKNNIDEAADLIKTQLKQQTHLDLSLDLIKETLKSLKLETRIYKKDFIEWIEDAIQIDFLKRDKIVSLDDFFQFF